MPAQLVYGAKPNSVVYGESVSEFRKTLGKKMAELYGDRFPAFYSVPVPDSAMHMGDGFSQQSGLETSRALLRKHYVRISLSPDMPEHERKKNVLDKLEVDRSAVRENMVVIEDSLNSGTTVGQIIDVLRSNGGKKIYLLLASPPRTPCPYRPQPGEPLFAQRLPAEQMANELHVNGIYWLGLQDMLSCLREPDKYCTECFGKKFGDAL